MLQLFKDRTLFEIKRSHLSIAFFVIIFIIALLIRLELAPFVSGDFSAFLTHWCDYLRQYGWTAFKDSFADYNPPYLYLLYLGVQTGLSNLEIVKAISILSDLLLAFSVGWFFYSLSLGKRKALVAATVTLFLPTVLMNGSLWGQCDALYTAIIILSLTFSIKNKAYAAWVLFGLALAFKLQTIFFLPFLVYMTFRSRKITLTSLLAPLAALVPFVVLLIPSLLAGRPLGSLLSIYSSQAGTYKSLTLNAPNLYYWLPDSAFDILKTAGMMFAVAAMGMLLYFLITRLPKENRLHVLLRIALVIALLAPSTLPQMHERYFFLAEIISLLLLFIRPGWYNLAVFMVLQIGAWASYMPFLLQMSPPIPLGVFALFYVAIITSSIYLLWNDSKSAGSKGALYGRA